MTQTLTNKIRVLSWFVQIPTGWQTNANQICQILSLQITRESPSKTLYTRARKRLINFPRTWGKQRAPGVWKGHPAHPVLFVFMQKINKFWFTATGMRIICGWRNAGSQSHLHIRAFGLRTIRHVRVYEA